MRTSVDLEWSNCVPENLRTVLLWMCLTSQASYPDLCSDILKKNPSSWAKLSRSTQACPSTPSSEGMDPVSMYCLTCSISHFTNHSGSYCFLRSARGWARYMWDALFNNSLKYWRSLRNPSLLSFLSSLPSSQQLPCEAEKPGFLTHLLQKPFNSLLRCGTVCSSGAGRRIRSRDNFFINDCRAAHFFNSGASEHYSNINTEKQKRRPSPK